MFQVSVEGAWKYLGESVTGSEIRIWNWWDGSCIAVRDGRVGTPMDVQVGWCDSTVHVQCFSHLKREADDCDVIGWHTLSFCLHRGLGIIQGECTWAEGFLSGFWVALHLVALCREPQTLSCSYLSASWGVRLQHDKEVFFICSAVSDLGCPGHLKLVCFCHLQVTG